MKTFIVDSFTDQAFKGNPAGVCIVDELPTDAFMLSIAQELNLSETAFIQKQQPDRYNIRYFSPVMEIPLCGHATLAAAKVLFEMHTGTQVLFKTAQGIELLVKKEVFGICMQFPVYQTIEASVPPLLLKALGIEGVVNSVYNDETRILLLEITDSRQLASLTPDFQALMHAHQDINGVLVTAPGHDHYDFHSRYFWPWSGTNEDPVTGGTHTFLAPYWAEKLQKTKMTSFQSSARSGFMEIEILDDQQMLIRGKAIITFEGTFRTRTE